MSKLEVENICDDVSIEYFLNKRISCGCTEDGRLSWMYQESGWNIFTEYLTKDKKTFSTSHILFLPFLHHLTRSLNTVYTTLTLFTTILSFMAMKHVP